MRRAYRFCLLLYPRQHRDQFADEMLNVFQEASAEGRDHGWTWYVRFAFSEVGGLVAGATQAWLAPQRPAETGTARSSHLPQELIEAQQRVNANIAGMVHAIANHQFERARVLSNQEREARENLRCILEKYGRDGAQDQFA
jgi:hypothetical protein